VRRVAAWPLTGGPHMSGIFQFQKISPIAFPHKKNRYKVRKILIKFMEVGNSIWNTSHYCNFFQIFTDFELFKRFEVKLGLTNLWSIKVLATAFANQPELHLGQGSLQGDLKTLYYHLVDMHKLTLQIQIVMAFQSCSLAKLKLEKFLSLEFSPLSSVWTL
jgi:hypothetical protein